MPATVRTITDEELSIADLVWSGRGIHRRLYQLETNEWIAARGGVSGADPDIDRQAAEMIVERFGGALIAFDVPAELAGIDVGIIE